MRQPVQGTAMERLIERLSRLPGIGRRSAQRIAFYLLKRPQDEVGQLAEAMVQFKQSARQCSVCWNLAGSDPCAVCTDPRRDHGLVLVVEQPSDMASVESTGLYRGVYHVLMGRLSPLEGLGPGDLSIDALVQRVRGGDEPQGQSVREVILGTNPTLEGDGTALYLMQILKKNGVKVTRLARGLPTGSNLEMVSKAVLSDAIHGRQAVS